MVECHIAHNVIYEYKLLQSPMQSNPMALNIIYIYIYTLRNEENNNFLIFRILSNKSQVHTNILLYISLYFKHDEFYKFYNIIENDNNLIRYIVLLLFSFFTYNRTQNVRSVLYNGLCPYN